MAYFTAISEILGLNVILALSVFATLMVGQFSLAQVGFWSIGAFVTAILTTMHGFPIYYALIRVLFDWGHCSAYQGTM